MVENDNTLHQLQLMNFNDQRRLEWESERKPYSALLEITPRCNMNCVHCYLQDHHAEQELTFEDIKKIIDVLYDKGILFLTLTGGEIFTRKDFAKIYMYAKKRGFMIELFTNCLALTDETVSMLKRYPPVMVDVTLYGACEDTYCKVTGIKNAFSKVIGNCRNLKEADVRISMRTPVLNITIDEIDDMREISQELGIPFAVSYEISPTIDRLRTSQNYQIDTITALELETKEFFNGVPVDYAPPNQYDGKPKPIFGCKIARGALVIDYNGNMFPCMKFRHIGQRLTSNNFDKLWDSYNDFYTMYTKPDNKCNSCDAAYYCEVCPAEMDFMYGDPEYRIENNCTVARYRKALHDGEFSSLDDALTAIKAMVLT